MNHEALMFWVGAVAVALLILGGVCGYFAEHASRNRRLALTVFSFLALCAVPLLGLWAFLVTIADLGMANVVQ